MPQSILKRGETALPRNRGTGFEGLSTLQLWLLPQWSPVTLTLSTTDGFADPPVTPDEYLNELEIYDS